MASYWRRRDSVRHDMPGVFFPDYSRTRRRAVTCQGQLHRLCQPPDPGLSPPGPAVRAASLARGLALQTDSARDRDAAPQVSVANFFRELDRPLHVLAAL